METDKFLERFNFFYDSVIRSVRVWFRNENSSTKLSITISTRDKESYADGGWVNVNIEISEVTEFNIAESSRESYQVISDGLHILQSEDLLFFDFGFHTDTPEVSEEFKKSKFYVVGKNLTWIVQAYQE